MRMTTILKNNLKNDTRKIISYSNKNKNADVFINKIIFKKNTVNLN